MAIQLGQLYFFDMAEHLFGRGVRNSLKELTRLETRLIGTKLKIVFLNNCKSEGLLPKHLHKFIGLDLRLNCSASRHRLFTAGNRFAFHLLKIEIRDSYHLLAQLRMKSERLGILLSRTVSSRLWERYTQIQQRRNWYFHQKERDRLINKFWYLTRDTEKQKMSHIKGIRYQFQVSTTTNNNRVLRSSQYQHRRIKTKTFTFKDSGIDIQRDNRDIISTVAISPTDYSHIQIPSIFHINDKWLLNLSSIDIPNNIGGLLQLGRGFCVPPMDKKKMVFEFIKHIEYNIRSCQVDERNVIREASIPIMKRLFIYKPTSKTINQEICQAYRDTIQFTANNDNILITRADKGNITVVMDKEAYKKGMLSLLSDFDTYIELLYDPNKTLTKNLHSLLTRWTTKGYITKMTYRRLNVTDGLLPRAYGMPKIHKLNNPLRIIVSSINSPLYEISVFLHHIIKQSIPIPPSRINNSFQLVELLASTTLEPHYQLVSLDVVSLFTNVPIELVIKSLRRRWSLIKANTQIPMSEFISAVRFILESTYFIFDNKIFQQLFGSPMGSPLSPILADIVLEDLEQEAIKRLPITLGFYFRYVDDILLAAPHEFLDTILEIFNSFHSRLKFTLEVGNNNKINFLDVSLIVIDGIITFDWYQKPTFSGRFLNFFSHHPFSQKKAMIFGLVDRVFLLSDPSFHEKNLRLIIELLIDNCYPLDFIFRMINRRISTLIERSGSILHTRIEKNKDNEITKKYFALPYVEGISDEFRSVITNSDTALAYRGLVNLSKIIRTNKDRLDTMEKRNIVYKLTCKDCDATYVGQTGRKLSTRIKEHKRIRGDLGHNNMPVVYEHMAVTGHDFDWCGTVVLEEEPRYYKRLISEMLHIKQQTNGLNSQIETELINNRYSGLLNLLRRT